LLPLFKEYLEDAGLISQYQKAGREMDSLKKPEKLYLNNTSQMYTISLDNSKNIGNIRETFFSQTVSPIHSINLFSNKSGNWKNILLNTWFSQGSHIFITFFYRNNCPRISA
jgi:predicted AAA+ superfamily ATPase